MRFFLWAGLEPSSSMATEEGCEGQVRFACIFCKSVTNSSLKIIPYQVQAETNLFLCQAKCICKLTEISFLTVCLNQLPWESRKIRVFVYIYDLILNQVIQMYYFVRTYSILYMLVELSPVLLLLLLRTWGFHNY